MASWFIEAILKVENGRSVDSHVPGKVVTWGHLERVKEAMQGPAKP